MRRVALAERGMGRDTSAHGLLFRLVARLHPIVFASSLINHDHIDLLRSQSLNTRLNDHS